MVERAVQAADMDDDEWRARLERGQKLAREAEANRRSSRDAQRSAEETIAKQAAEIKRLKDEAKARAPGGRSRSWRSYEVSYLLHFSFFFFALHFFFCVLSCWATPTRPIFFCTLRNRRGADATSREKSNDK